MNTDYTPLPSKKINNAFFKMMIASLVLVFVGASVFASMVLLGSPQDLRQQAAISPYTTTSPSKTITKTPTKPPVVTTNPTTPPKVTSIPKITPVPTTAVTVSCRFCGTNCVPERPGLICPAMPQPANMSCILSASTNTCIVVYDQVCEAPPKCLFTNPSCDPPPNADGTSKRYCKKTDFNLDGKVDVADYQFMASRFFQTTADALRADVTFDNKVDLLDYVELVKEWTAN